MTLPNGFKPLFAPSIAKKVTEIGLEPQLFAVPLRKCAFCMDKKVWFEPLLSHKPGTTIRDMGCQPSV